MILNILILLSFLITINCFQSFHSNKMILSKYSINMVKISARKALFFDIVESGLRERYDNMNTNGAAARVFQFCKYAKNEVGFPVSGVKGHEPCEEYIDKLTAQPWWDTTSSQFEWVNKLEEASPIIREELQSVLNLEMQSQINETNEINEDTKTFKGDSRYQLTMGDGWTAFRLQRLGEWNEANMKTFPKTTSIIQNLNIPLAVRGVMFAKQAPSSGVKPHSDGRNFILTAHLGLNVPSSSSDSSSDSPCWIEVAGERKTWNQDKVIIFDTSFTHCTANDSNEDRYVLIIDFWHPELSSIEQDALNYIYDCRNKFESGRTSIIDSPYVTSGQTLDEDEYERKRQSIGNSIFSFFTDGGLVKFNPMQK